MITFGDGRRRSGTIGVNHSRGNRIHHALQSGILFFAACVLRGRCHGSMEGRHDSGSNLGIFFPLPPASFEDAITDVNRIQHALFFLLCSCLLPVNYC